MSYKGVQQVVRYGLGATLKVTRPVHIKPETGATEEFKHSPFHSSFLCLYFYQPAHSPQLKPTNT